MTAPQIPGASGVLGRAITALKPYGPTPIVCTAIGGLGLGALGGGANPIGVVAVVAMTFIACLIGQERKAKWRREELEAEFDARAKGDARAIRTRLDDKRKRAVKKDEPTLTGTTEASHDGRD